MVDITSLGEFLIDFTECGLSPAGMRLFEQNPGGAVVNLVAAAAKLGASTAFIGKVGEDMHGAFLKRALQQAGVNTEYLIGTGEAFTTLAFVALGAEGERTFSFARKPGADTLLRPEELPAKLLAQTRIFHTGSLSLTAEPVRSATYRAIALARSAGAVVTYDPNYRPSLWDSPAAAIKSMRSLVPTAQIMKLSDQEIGLLTDSDDPVEASRRLVDAGVPVVAVTLGKEGALIRVGGQVRHVPGFVSKVVDTTGAGDAFFGGFLYRYLQFHRQPEELRLDEACDCARFGNAVASLCVEKRGAIPAMPELAAVEARLARG